MLLTCSICDKEVPFHTGIDEKNLVCTECIRVNRDPKAGNTTGLDSLQKVFEKSLELQPQRDLIEMKRLTLYCNFARDKVIMFDDIAVRFDENGNGTTPEHNRSKITKFMKQRPGRVSIVEDAPQVVAEVAVADSPKEEPKKEAVVSTKELPPVDEEVEAPKETEEPPKKRGRKPKKKDTED